MKLIENARRYGFLVSLIEKRLIDEFSKGKLCGGM